MAIAITRSKLVLILVILFTVIVAALAIGTAILLQTSNVGPGKNKAALCSGASTNGTGQAYNGRVGVYCQTSRCSDLGQTWYCDTGGFGCSQDPQFSGNPAQAYDEKNGVYCNNNKCSPQGQTWFCVNNGNGCTQDNGNGFSCGNNVCHNGETSCDQNNNCASPGSPACTGTTTVPVTTTASLPTCNGTQGAGQCQCAGNLCTNGTKITCSGAGGGTCTPVNINCSELASGAVQCGSSSNYIKDNGRVSEGASDLAFTVDVKYGAGSPANLLNTSASGVTVGVSGAGAFGNCDVNGNHYYGNSGCNVVGVSGGTCTISADRNGGSAATGGTITGQNCMNAAFNASITSGIPAGYKSAGCLIDGTTNGNIKCSQNAGQGTHPVQCFIVPVATVVHQCYYCAPAASGTAASCNGNNTAATWINSPSECPVGSSGDAGFGDQNSCETASNTTGTPQYNFCHYSGTATPTPTTTPPTTTTTTTPPTTTPPTTTTTNTTTTPPTTTTTTTTTSSTPPTITTTTPPLVSYSCTNITLTNNGGTFTGTVTTGDQVGFTINGSNTTTGTGYNLSVDGTPATSGSGSGSSGSYTYTVPVSGNLFQIIGYASFNGTKYFAAACNALFNRVGVTPPSLTIAKAASPAVVAPGGTINITLTVTNNGGSATTVNEVTDTLPTGFTYNGSPVLTTPSGTAPISEVTTGNNLVFTLNGATGVNLAAGANMSITFSVKAPNVSQCTTYVNVATITSPPGGSDQTNMGVCTGTLPNTGAFDGYIISMLTGVGLVAASYIMYRFDIFKKLSTRRK